ncbi:inositol monophosphatase family protein [Nocardioides ferulae]|uniref:inositol monophosphatase family protein n=1 Tax=Nocardioides ferulae TaxID=2340821 RepID=UPI000EB218F7|nr:inositol monophosphatase family protein [Nocardioides ferulae]
MTAAADAGLPGGHELIATALEVARAAAALVRDRARGEVSVASIKSSDTDVVTEVDRAAEELIRGLLGRLRPGDAVHGEEGEDLAGSTGVRWVLDPIDGTVNFLYGIPQYAVSVAAQVLVPGAPEAGTVAGVVIDVAAGTEYAAFVRPDGEISATRDGRSLRVRGPAPLSQRLVATGFSYDAGVRELQAQALVRLLPRVRDIRRFGSCALDLCHVAEGRFDGYVEEGVNLWDHAAAALVARGAGARVEVTRGAGGGEAVVCAPEHGFDELRQAVAEAGYLAT